MKRLRILTAILLFVASFFLLGLSVKGQIGNPIYFQKEKDIRIGGPFEASNSTARYALTESIVERHTYFLDATLTKFSAPDVVTYNGKSLSIFTPGISFIAVPFYMLGKVFNMPQLFAYLSTALFALCNVFLVARLSSKLGASLYASLLSGFLFLFGTNAFSYAQSLTQHHVSTTILLLALLNAAEERTIVRNVILGALVGAGALMDIPNVIMLFPVVLYVLSKHLIIKKDSFTKEKITLSLKLSFIGLLIGIAPLFYIFGNYNSMTAGSPLRIAQNIGRTTTTDTHVNPLVLPTSVYVVKPPVQSKRLFSLPFSTRTQLSGLYTLLISDERSWLFYSPVVLLGILGFSIAYRLKRYKILTSLCIAVSLLDLVLYSMFGDPWGGWSFGPRYLIPAAAVVCSGIGIALDKYKFNPMFVLIFMMTAVYILAINTIGALTTASIPPKSEALNLLHRVPYTYLYNLQLIAKNHSSSLFYNLFLAKHIDANIFVLYFILMLLIPLSLLYILLFLDSRNKKGLV